MYVVLWMKRTNPELAVFNQMVKVADVNCGGDPAACRELDPMAEPHLSRKRLLLSTHRRVLSGSFLNGESDFPSRNQSLSTRRAVPSSDSPFIERSSECLPRQIVDFLRRLGNASVMRA